jgi:hypothetical protein
MSTTLDPQATEPIRLIGVDGYEFLGDSYTVERKCTFIGLYREQGSIYHAARLTPVSRKTIYNWIAVDEQFAEAVADSKEDSLDDLETSVYKRAFNDSLLAMFYLKAHRHKFRDKTTIDITVVQAEIEERMAKIGIRQLPPAAQEYIDTRAASAPSSEVTEAIPAPVSPATKSTNNNPSPEQ